ncbi:MAG TPA: alpha-amylase family glycosyl hydrolase [Tahibacter sp.]|uniref:alpha-amylase family glycosyl hydrolase n=1 Tax=Tahibacter sp. TaxID=2056211 RepID=UPI002C7126D1|nr:alpha-amylase family glycosyl hydrolase [Tahibacter sp.]HSX60186.1 alpha-amylase family glycosyl hydrolase [Tahibacter sp.]
MSARRFAPVLALALAAALASGCTPRSGVREYYGTAAPFASDAVYFVVTDRFVNGDLANDHREQGAGPWHTFDRPIRGPGGDNDNIGYLGGDLRGVLDNAAYLRDLGFSAVWITPIVDNPDFAFSGGDAPSWGSLWTDRGKTGYHGYWGTNFYRADEHLVSRDLDFAGFTRGMHAQGLKVVLDIVANHGSPAFGMDPPLPGFGQVFDADGRLLADHQNLPPAQLDPAHVPLHRFYKRESELAQLSNFDDASPEVLDYLAGAYLQWIAQGADAFRIDTVSLMPPAFWQRFADRIRAKHPGFFLFGEAFNYDAAVVAQYTKRGGGEMSVLDFPLKQAIATLLEKPGSDYAGIVPALHLADGPYRNPYELMTFYDNHDMARLDATDAGFVDAHNLLFTVRGIPVVYYGSEVGFMRGSAEHAGNRNYFGQERVDAARASTIHENLRRIARIRAASPALQRGLQVNLEFSGDRAAFYRVYARGDAQQIALVLLNKGDTPQPFRIARYLQAGTWRSEPAGRRQHVAPGGALITEVAPHGVQVWLLDAAVTDPALRAELDRLAAQHRTSGG